MKINDGKTNSEVAVEFVTSISVPIIPDADAYMAEHGRGVMFTIQLPPGCFGLDGCVLAFTKETGAVIEAWMAKHCVAERGDKIAYRLEDQGHIRMGVRRGGH